MVGGWMAPDRLRQPPFPVGGWRPLSTGTSCLVCAWGPNDLPGRGAGQMLTPVPRPERTRGLPALAGGAVGRAAAAEHDLPQWRGAPGAGATCLAVGDQVVGVAAALAVDHAVVAEGGAFAGDGVGEDLTDGAMESMGAAEADPAGGGVDAGQPEGLVGVDVADAGDRALGEQVGLDRGAGGGQVTGEAGRVELVREGLGAEVGQGRQGPVGAGLDH